MNGQGVLTIDLHGRNVYQARVSVDAALRRAPGGTYRIRLIHGSHLGTAIRDMLRAEYAGHPRVLRVLADGENATVFVLRELI